MADISLEAQIACVLRELALRQKVYPRWTALNKMSPAQAEHELKTMEAVYRTLLAMQERDAAQRPMFATDERN